MRTAIVIVAWVLAIGASWYLVCSALALYTIDEPVRKAEPHIKVVHVVTYEEDSLCRVWVDSTHLRNGFKVWYKEIYKK